MANAEAPSLRRKTKDFKYGMPLLDISLSETENTTRGIEKKTWCTLLKSIKTPALKPKSSSRPAQRRATAVSTRSDQGQEFSTGEMILSSQSSSLSQRSVFEGLEKRLRTGSPVAEARKGPTLTPGIPMVTPQSSGQERREPILKISHHLLPDTIGTRGPASPLSTPVPDSYSSSARYGHPNSCFPSDPSPWGSPLLTDSTMSHGQQQSSGGFANNNQHYPSNFQGQSYYPQASQDHNVYAVSSHGTDLGLGAVTQGTTSVMDSTKFGSFEDFLGDASMANWDRGFGTKWTSNSRIKFH